MKVIFFGTPPFAAHVLEYLLQHGVEIAAVITKPDRPQGRSAALVPTAVKQTALAWNPALPVYQPEIVSSPDFQPILEGYQADLFVVVAYGEIIKQHLLDMPKTACINLHASLLPKYRGAAPIQRCIIEGEKETGVTIIHMAKKMDAGDMIATAHVPIGPDTTYGELEEALCNAGQELLLKTIRNLTHGICPRIPQDPSQVTFAPKIELQDCQIDWKQPSQAIHNLVRGVNPHPGAWCMVDVREQPKRLHVIKTQICSESPQGSPGQILHSSKDGLIVSCGQGSLKLLEVKLEGKKAMSGQEFARGFPEGTLSLIRKDEG